MTEIDATPTWGEIGLLFFRLATSKEVRAINAGKSEFCKAFAMAQALSELRASFTPEQEAQWKDTVAREMKKMRVDEYAL